ncbi:DNA polymerase IV, partial [Janibacter melonis]|nr:DNA polymerase IV [Janibacter melonis]
PPPRRNWSQVMGTRPTTALWGVGSRIGSRLATHGYETVDQLAAADDEVLAGEFGPRMGPHYGRLGRGEGPDVVDDTPWVARAHGRETTYQRDLTDLAEVEAALLTLAEQVVEDIRAEGRACQRVHLKVRFAPFFTTTRIRTLPEATDDPFAIARTATELLRALDDDRPIRLLGIRAEMVPPEGGYKRPRTTGRGGPAAADPSAEE